MSGTNRELVDFHCSEIKFESGMLGGRLNSFLFAQAFLVIGYASSMSGSIGQRGNAFIVLFPPALALLGLVLAVHAYPGIRAAFAVIEGWHARLDELYLRDDGLAGLEPPSALDPSTPDRSAGRERRFRQSVVFARHTPAIFVIAWIYFGALPILLFALS